MRADRQCHWDFFSRYVDGVIGVPLHEWKTRVWKFKCVILDEFSFRVERIECPKSNSLRLLIVVNAFHEVGDWQPHPNQLQIHIWWGEILQAPHVPSLLHFDYITLGTKAASQLRPKYPPLCSFEEQNRWMRHCRWKRKRVVDSICKEWVRFTCRSLASTYYLRALLLY